MHNTDSGRTELLAAIQSTADYLAESIAAYEEDLRVWGVARNPLYAPQPERAPL